MHADILKLLRNDQWSDCYLIYLTSNMITCTNNQIENR